MFGWSAKCVAYNHMVIGSISIDNDSGCILSPMFDLQHNVDTIDS